MNPLLLFKLASACSTGIFGGSSSATNPGLYDGLTCVSGGGVQMSSLSDILVIIGNLVRILMTFSGVLAVLMIIVGGVFYTTSAGNPDRLKRAKEIITQAVTGLVVIMLAYGIITFIVGQYS